MTTYFTAADDVDARTALTHTPTGDEVLTSTVTPDDSRFTALIELVTGKSLDELDDDRYAVHSDIATDATANVSRLGSALTAEIANYDSAEFADLAGPWERSEAFENDNEDLDLVDFLTDLQHLCRNAVATNGAVYAVETS